MTVDGSLKWLSYDSNGNRTGGNVAGVPTTATYDNQDRILTWNHLSFTHNHNGERITKTDTNTSDTTTYAYDEMGLLTSVTLPNSDVIEYIADLDPSTGEVRTRYVYASQSHSPDFMIRAGTTYRILKDRLGSVRLVVRTSDGVIAQEIKYDEFGRRLLDTNPGFQPFGFAGGLTDLETGLVRFGARDYDPITGRWTTRDPIGFEGGDPNLYGYVLQDPVNLIDPEGLAGIGLGSTMRRGLVSGVAVGIAVGAATKRPEAGVICGAVVAAAITAINLFEDYNPLEQVVDKLFEGIQGEKP